ncbi:MAG: hypothetical protein MUE44_05400 [Oscillatoriaceae cyanobacterium Prado104]|nr:hypothetical protein [Oscillatoriaceae cyanobacterium Prado104]
MAEPAPTEHFPDIGFTDYQLATANYQLRCQQYNLLAAMKISTLSNLVTRVAGKFPLRKVLIVPFVLQIVGTVGLGRF